MSRLIRVSALAMILSLVAEGGVQIPPVPPGHPRVYLRPEDLPDIRRKIGMAEFVETWEKVRNSHHPLCRAFLYLITGDERAGREAIEARFKSLEKDWDNPDRLGRVFFNYMHVGACIYDWCYDLLSEVHRGVQEDRRLASPGVSGQGGLAGPRRPHHGGIASDRPASGGRGHIR